MMTQVVRRAFAVAAALACAASLACSFSHSSGSSSDSSRSSSGSSGSSGSSADDKKAFRNDVSQYTEAFVEAGGEQQQTFFSGLSDLARKRGVSDWEAEPSTWEAIGWGLGRTEINDAQHAAYEAAWADGDAGRASAMARGFANAR